MKRLLLLVLLALSACTTTVEQDFPWYQNHVTPLDEYTVYQSYMDTGFAGIDAVNESAQFVVQNAAPQSDTNTTYLVPHSMEWVRDDAWQFTFDEHFHFDTFSCFFHSEMLISQAVICYEDQSIVYYSSLFTQGNHQRRVESWQLDTFSLQQADCSDRDFLCPIFTTAKAVDPTVCSVLTDLRSSCEN